MKKLLGIFAACALLFGAVSCSNDEGIMDVDSAVSASKETGTILQNIAAFSIKNAAGNSVDSVSVLTYLKTTLTTSQTENVTVDSDDDSIATASFDAGTITITGVAAGTTFVTVAYEGFDVAIIPVTVEAATAYQATYFPVTMTELVYTSTLGGASGASSALTAGNITATQGHTGSEALGALNAVTNGYVQTPSDAADYAAEEAVMTYTFTITAKKALKVVGLSYIAANNQTGNTQIVTSYVKGTADSVTADTLAADGSKNFAGDVSFDSLELAADETITFTLLHQILPAKTVSGKVIKAALQDVVLTVIDISE
ncbi:hypothetical protein [Treponema sp.]|uniref:hypothetical protein n=1 Tax=Treponema sp. TaxID=166 RepID=UPI00388F920C